MNHNREVLEPAKLDTWDIESTDGGQLFIDRSRKADFDYLWINRTLGFKKHISFRLRSTWQRLFSLELQWSALRIFGHGSKTAQSQPKTDLLIIFYQTTHVLQVSKTNVLKLSINILNSLHIQCLFQAFVSLIAYIMFVTDICSCLGTCLAKFRQAHTKTRCLSQ